MVLRNIVKIDEQKCNGCGLCVKGCVEGAIEIIEGKARLVSDTYCDGLGACIGHCPQDAITIEQRESAEFDEKAAKKHIAKKTVAQQVEEFVCPGMANIALERAERTNSVNDGACSRLEHWPVQLKLISPDAEYLKNADLLLVGDCVPFAMGDFHERFLKGHRVLVGCPKLDDPDYYIEKLAEIIRINKPASLGIIHMEVPCCFGLVHIAKRSIELSGLNIATDNVTIGINGAVIRTG